MKQMLVWAVWISLLNNAIALAQTNMPATYPRLNSMPDFPTRQFVARDEDTEIDEPSGAPLDRINLFELPQFAPDAKRVSFHRRELPPAEQFSFNNLLDGLIYDFRQKDNMRIEFGGPGLGEWELTEADVKYDVPFCLLILLNRRF